MKLSSNDYGLLILRLGLGLVMLYFGCQKAMGVFGGPGFNGTLGFMSKMGIPTVFAILAICAEFLGALGVIVGLLSRIAAFGIFCTMSVATYLSIQNGTAAKIFSTQSGMEPPKLFFPLILAFIALALVIIGPGQLSLDARLFKAGRKK